jgi:hypothetical protein
MMLSVIAIGEIAVDAARDRANGSTAMVGRCGGRRNDGAAASPSSPPSSQRHRINAHAPAHVLELDIAEVDEGPAGVCARTRS